MSSEHVQLLLEEVRQMRKLLELLAEPAIAQRDAKLRDELRTIVGSSTPKQESVLLMDGSRTQAQLISGNRCISNATVVKQYVEEHLKTKDAKKIMRECEDPKTRTHLQTIFSYRSAQALDYHLKPLREADLLRQRVEDDGTIVFEWSNLFRRLPKSAIRAVLADGR
jgi:hypothetical protein